MIDKKEIEKLPNQPGVYLIRKKKTILYIGKSTNIKERIKNHLEQTKIDNKERKLFEEADNIKYYLFDSDLKITLKEAELIKKYKPKYNVRWKDDKNFLYIKITDDPDYPKVLLVRKKDETNKNCFGPFASKKEALTLLREIRKFIPFCTERKITKKPCLYSKIKLCDPCPNYIESLNDENEKKKLKKRYKRNINLLLKFLKGNFSSITADLEKKLKNAIEREEYEKGIELREKIKIFKTLVEKKLFFFDNGGEINLEEKLHSLTKFLRDYFPQLQLLKRIEGYDLSNLSFQERAGSMVVFVNGYPDKSQYRRFKIEEKRSDADMLREVIKRRLNNPWQLPDLIVVDGGVAQIKTALSVLKEKGLNIPVIGIVKNPDRLVIPTPENRFKKIKIEQIPANEIIINLRNESHRFAKKYHLYLRKKDFLN